MPRNTTSSARCKALLEDGKTPCQKAPRRKTWQYCPEHVDQYKEATAAYKRASERAEELKKTVCALRGEMSTLTTPSQVDLAISVVKRWQSAIAEEVRRREEHHKRFFPLGGASCVPSHVGTSMLNGCV